MFGYIKTYKPELKIREFEAYKAVYCTLCKQLRKDYGFIARFTLNFDYTFLAMIRMAGLQTEAEVEKSRCPFNPLAKCNRICCKDDSIAYAAAVAMMMVYHKLMDTVQDESFFKGLLARVGLLFASRWNKKASKRYPEIARIISSYWEEQERQEASCDQGFDRFCHPTANALSQIFSFSIPNDETRRILSVIGYNIGKWVYLADGLDDWEADQKHKRFNPYTCRLGGLATKEQVADFAIRQMNVCLDEACLAYELLPQKNFSPILKNILFLGLEQVQNEIIRKGKKDD